MIGRPPRPASRRRSRQLRLAQGSSRFWSTLQLIFSFWLLYALALVGIAITAPGEEGALLPTAQLIRSALFLGLSGFAILSALRALRNLIASYLRETRIEAPAARDFLAAVAQSGEEYVLVLRPAGAGAHLFLSVETSLGERWRDPDAASATVEQLVAAEVRKTLGLRTIALADPQSDEVAPGPDYVAIDEEGHAAAEALIARAHSVFVIVPPGDQSDLGWELGEIFRKGLIGRAVVILPPRQMKRPAQVEGLTAAMVPHATGAERRALVDYLLGDVILAELSEEPEFWADAPSRFGPFARSTARAYALAIAECIEDIAAAMPPPAERYPYFHTSRRRIAPRLTLVPPAARTAND